MTDLVRHHEASGTSDRIALGITKFLRWFADAFFAKRYGHRAIVLETVAAVPGMVGGMMNHLKPLRRMRDDNGWIKELLDETSPKAIPSLPGTEHLDRLRPDPTHLMAGLNT